MSRTIVIGDIHGFYDEFLSLLALCNFKKDVDKLILLGDYVDKGTKSKEVIQYVMQLVESGCTVAISGNHDELFLNWLDGIEIKHLPYTGDKVVGDATVRSFVPFYEKGVNDEEAREFIKTNFVKEIEFLKNLPDFFEDEEHIYVHAGIDPELSDWKLSTKRKFRWIRTPFYENSHPHEKTVVFGHTSTAVIRGDFETFDVWFSDKKIGIDGGIKFGGQLNALVISNGEYSTFSVSVKESKEC